MTGATYSVTRCSFGLCLRLLLREPCGNLAGPQQNSTAPIKHGRALMTSTRDPALADCIFPAYDGHPHAAACSPAYGNHPHAAACS